MSAEDAAAAAAGDMDMGFEYYRYTPSIPAAVVAIILFALSTLAHGGQSIWRRTWYWIPFIIGGICQCAGYIGRIMSSNETPNWEMGPYILQTIMILVAAALYAASIYMVLKRIVVATNGERHSIIPVKWLTKLFVISDVISIFMQLAGGALLAMADLPADFHTGEMVIVGGLFVQLAGFGLFLVVSAIFHRRMIRAPTEASQSPNMPWQQYMSVLYAGSVLILVRSIFRIIEYLQGNAGYLMAHEVFLYIFDAVLMFTVSCLFNVYHPGSLISRETLSKGQYMSESDMELQNSASEQTYTRPQAHVQYQATSRYS